MLNIFNHFYQVVITSYQSIYKMIVYCVTILNMDIKRFRFDPKTKR